MAHTPQLRFGQAADLLGCVRWLPDHRESACVIDITVSVDGGSLASTGV